MADVHFFTSLLSSVHSVGCIGQARYGPIQHSPVIAILTW